MSGMLGIGREAIRIKVKKFEPSQPPDYRKFSVDPQITSFEVLQSIISKAFDLKNDFAISYSMQDVQGNEVYMPLLSDWELDAAFLKAHNSSLGSNSEPCLSLLVDLKPFEESSDDWEVRNNLPVITQLRTGTAQEAKPSPRFHGIINQMGKTFNSIQRALNFGDDGSGSTCLQPPRPPLSDSEFRRFLDPVGQIIHTKDLKSVIYLGGIDSSLRKVVWKHLLNVYPDGMTGKERMDYIKKLANDYINLRDIWKKALESGNVNGELGYTTGMVRKDVLRTDRHHPFYAGSDDNQNVTSLFNILTTYALNHPKVSYCQGMSDLASPLLVTMGDEAHAYICFCSLMSRLCSNFMLDGIAMTQKFTHLSEGIMYYDPEFYNYLKVHQADDLLFCYRWLLLEMKREFAFEDSLRMLEVLWSSLRSNPPCNELKLYDVKFQPSVAATRTPPISPLLKTPRENAYTKVCALRRQSSSISLNNYPAKSAYVPRQNHSLDESIGRMNKSSSVCFPTKNASMDDTKLIKEGTEEIDDEIETVKIEEKTENIKCVSFKNGVLTQMLKLNNLSASVGNISGLGKKSLKDRLLTSKMTIFSSSLEGLNNENETINHQQRVVRNLNEFLYFASLNKPSNDSTKQFINKTERVLRGRRHHSTSSAPTSGNEECSNDTSPEEIKENIRLENEVEHVKNVQVFVWENPLPEKSPTPAVPSTSEKDVTNSCEEITEANRHQILSKRLLPPPEEFGGGNPFLMFLCLTVLLQHRDHIMNKNMDYNEMAMHFDKMIRKHNVNKVLNQARQMYANYLKQYKMTHGNQEEGGGDCL